ncbi:MAG TPA: amino acid permease [Deltaproteobacteria bacterium]|nr:amino acid permease [Deltaproteobacteria bacterium]
MQDHVSGAKHKDEPLPGTLSTFAGVFTPSILTILGIILFMRLGYVVGSAGLARAFVIIALANSISVLTTFSLSAIATNFRVKGGGDYYLISRTLGVEFGGAIGTVLFIAQSVSIAFYAIGFGEVVSGFFATSSVYVPQIIAAFAVSVLFVLAWLGTDYATRFQYVVMVILAAALVSFFAGGLMKWDSVVLKTNFAVIPSSGFWILFAIFFPAVTGFTQGVSMSGDLKDPGKSLPTGTFLAVGLSMIIYFAVALFMAAAAPRDVLTGDYAAMRRVAFSGFLIDAGVIAATLSSAMASFMGAPRILQSMAGDRIFPFLVPFAKGYGPTGNPRRGILLSAAIAFATITLGKLNIIAPVVSMFFLISYGLLNYATYFEARAASPSFRPRFGWYDLRLSLLGAVACLAAMFAINAAAGAVALAMLFAIYQYIKKAEGVERWVDSRRSFHLQQVREHLLAAAHEPEHPRDWRPQLLAFSNDVHRRRHLLQFSSWLEGGSGMTTAVRILEGQGVKMLRLKEEAETKLRKTIEDHKLTAFPLVVVAPNAQDAIQTLVQGFGIGPVKVNTVVINWFEQSSKGFLGIREKRYGLYLRTAFRLGCNLIVLDSKEDEWTALDSLSANKRRIDVWWWGDATSRLMLLLAYLMTRSFEWRDARIRMYAVAHGESSDNQSGLPCREFSGNGAPPQTEKEVLDCLIGMLDEVRIDARIEVVPNADTREVVRRSADASMVFFPFRLRENQLLTPFGDPVEELLSGLPIVALGLAAEDIDLESGPEEGKVAELAAALDAVEKEQKRFDAASNEAGNASKYTEEKSQRLQELISSGADEEEIARAQEEKTAALHQEELATRKVAKALAKVEEARRLAAELGAKPAQEDKPPDTTKASEKTNDETDKSEKD